MTHAMSEDGATMQVLLDLCDQADGLRENWPKARGDAARHRVLRQKAQIRGRLRRILRSGIPRSVANALKELGRDRSFSLRELSIIMLLLHRRITDADYCLLGRDLLWLLYDTSFGVFRGTQFLAPDGRLRQSGVITAVSDPEDEDDDYLNHLFFLSHDVYRAIGRQQSGTRGSAGGAAHAPYADNTDYFLDLDQLATIYGRRAARSFAAGVWQDLHGEPYESVAALTDQIERKRRAIRQHLEATPDARHFALNVFQTEFNLRPIEMIIVVALMSQEALAGNAFLDCIDVLRLVSSSSRDLLRKRILFDERSPLIRNDIVEVDDFFADKVVTGHCRLANWVVDRLLDGRFRGDLSIKSEEKIEFHNYLSRLSGSDDFFDKLD